MRWIDIATEDRPSHEVALRLVAELPGFAVGATLGGSGNGYLRQRMRSFHRIAHTRPILILTDQDRCACAPLLMAAWMGEGERPTGMLFRVVVRTIESWLLADHEAMAQWLGARAARGLPPAPDDVADPKSLLVRLAMKAPKDVRLDICPAPGAQTTRGVNYNNRLTQFIQTQWSPERAATRSPSLSRARLRLGELVVSRGRSGGA
jgi:hypothetical protein